MKLKFLGTRGEIGLRTRLHRMHSSAEISYRDHSVMIDCGADWLESLPKIKPEAIVLTHAHPDHAWGLKAGAPCPVFATEATWHSLEPFPVPVRLSVSPRSPFRIHRILFEAFTVEHSIRAPAVGYRITAGRSAVFYAPDLVYIHERHEALAGITAYVGDGASLHTALIHRRNGALIGHAAIGTQLGWCRQEGVRRAFLTHCGSEIVGSDARTVTATVRNMGTAQGIEARIAFDGLEITLP